MHRSRLGQVLIDVPAKQWEQALEFWGRALGRSAVEPPRDSPRYVRMPGRDGEPDVLLQRIDADEAEYHLDIETDDLEKEVARLTSHGAVVVERVKQWVVMRAPTGHVFCVIPVETDGFESFANSHDT